MVLSCALGYSPCLPVSVCGTGHNASHVRGFSWKHGASQLIGAAVHLLIPSRGSFVAFVSVESHDEPLLG